MPIYEFKCCDTKHEIFCKYEESDEVKCPKCGENMKKLISRPAVLITDTSFCMTGEIDDRLGKRPIEGRADWSRMRQKLP